MNGFEFYLLTLAWFPGRISPGPATMAIAGTSMEQDRAHSILAARQ